ncbi:MAG: hypothetical protein L3J04_06255 [Robiginitomaculum sp.]|nr:hypothetical protein [Robiginitomaculum sp.]
MTNTKPTQSPTTESVKIRPTHRITFARIIGKDKNGNNKPGLAREIGAIWPRKNGKKGGILKLDHVPAELALHQGVIFTLPVDPNYQQKLV